MEPLHVENYPGNNKNTLAEFNTTIEEETKIKISLIIN